MNAPIVEVTVLEDRARVIRRGTVSLPAGQTRVIVRGVAPVLVDKTLTATASTGRVLDVRCVRRLAPWRDAAGPSERSADAQALAARVDALVAEAAQIEIDVAAIAREASDLSALYQIALAELAAEAAWGRLPATSGDDLARLDARERDATARLAARRLELERAERDLATMRARATEALADAGRETAEVEIDLVCDAAADAQLAIEYLVPGACWRPYHTATLRDGRVIFATDACVWQSTGEDWRDARLSFSTERPSLGARPPTLESDPIVVQRKSDVVVVEARDHDLDTTGLGSQRATAVAAQVPGVDDGGVAQTLRAPHPATVPCDGHPYRIGLGSHDADAELALVAFPERSPCAFTRTRQPNGARPLLAGPVDLIRDAGQVGRTSILYVAPEERFELGWGAEPDLRLHRDEERSRDEAGMLGSWNVTRVRVAVRLSNLGERARTVEVTERVPVSEIDKVEISVAPEPWDLEEDVEVVRARTIDDDGLVRWQVELPPRGRRAVALEYHIRAHTSVVGL